MAITEFSKILISDESSLKEIIGNNMRGSYLAALGTKEGKVVIYRLGVQNTRLYQSKAGVAFGSVTAVDVAGNGSVLVAATESGEMIVYDLLAKLNE